MTGRQSSQSSTFFILALCKKFVNDFAVILLKIWLIFETKLWGAFGLDKI